VNFSFQGLRVSDHYPIEMQLKGKRTYLLS